MKLSGIILAGGRSKRFGINKLEIKIGQIPLFIDQVIKLSLFCDQILIVTSAQNSNFILQELNKINNYINYYKPLDFSIPEIKVADDEKTQIPALKSGEDSVGPIMGIYTGLKNSKNLYNIVVAFDMPFISEKILNLLISALNDKKSSSGKNKIKHLDEELFDVVITRNLKGFEALCGLYSKNCIGAFQRSIARGNYKILDVFDKLNSKIITNDLLIKYKVDQLNFFNINKINDYYRFTDIWNISFSGLDFIKKWKKFFYRKNLYFDRKFQDPTYIKN